MLWFLYPGRSNSWSNYTKHFTPSKLQIASTKSHFIECRFRTWPLLALSSLGENLNSLRNCTILLLVCLENFNLKIGLTVCTEERTDERAFHTRKDCRIILICFCWLKLELCVLSARLVHEAINLILNTMLNDGFLFLATFESDLSWGVSQTGEVNGIVKKWRKL